MAGLDRERADRALLDNMLHRAEVVDVNLVVRIRRERSIIRRVNQHAVQFLLASSRACDRAWCVVWHFTGSSPDDGRGPSSLRLRRVRFSFLAAFLGLFASSVRGSIRGFR